MKKKAKKVVKKPTTDKERGYYFALSCGILVITIMLYHSIFTDDFGVIRTLLPIVSAIFFGTFTHTFLITKKTTWLLLSILTFVLSIYTILLYLAIL